METNPTPSKAARWTGWIFTILPSLLLIFSAIMKFSKTPEVIKGFEHYGIGPDLLTGLGVLELAVVIIYLIPRTAVLGMILVTGYFGGVIMTNLRIGDGWWPVAISGVIMWGGLYLRDPRLRALIPFRRL